MLCTLCHMLYPAYCKRNSGSRSNNFVKKPCQTLQTAQLSSSRACSLPTNSSPGNCRVNPTWEIIQQKSKSSFLCWAYPSAGSGLWAMPAQGAQRVIVLAWEKENKHSALLGEWQDLHLLVAVTAHCLKCLWTSLCPQRKTNSKAESSLGQK